MTVVVITILYTHITLRSAIKLFVLGRNHRQNHNNPMIQIESEITTTVEIVITPDVDLEDS